MKGLRQVEFKEHSKSDSRNDSWHVSAKNLLQDFYQSEMSYLYRTNAEFHIFSQRKWEKRIKNWRSRKNTPKHVFFHQEVFSSNVIPNFAIFRFVTVQRKCEKQYMIWTAEKFKGKQTYDRWFNYNKLWHNV